MNKLVSEAEAWAQTLKEELEHVDFSEELLICAPFTHLVPLVTVLNSSPVTLGAQTVSEHEAGAYTGEVSATMLKDIGVRYVIIGHSERRAYHHESDAQVNAKAKQALANELRPIICIGESESQRDAGEAETVVLSQLRAALESLTFEDAQDVVIAYEPIWAIGTGKTATADDAQAMCGAIRQALRELYPDKADEMRILYGGSMKPANAADLLGKQDINGGLIGGASLNVDDLLAIAKAA